MILETVLKASLVLSSKESACQCWRPRFNAWVRKIPRRRKWQPTPIFLPGTFHRQSTLADYGLQGCKRVGHGLLTKQQPVILDDSHGHYCGRKKPVSEVVLHDGICDILKVKTMAIDQWLPQVKSGESISLQTETGGLFERWWNCSVSCLWWWLRKCARVKIHRTINQKKNNNFTIC